LAWRDHADQKEAGRKKWGIFRYVRKELKGRRLKIWCSERVTQRVVRRVWKR